MKNLICIFLIGLLAGCRDDRNALIFNVDEINGIAYLKDPFFETNPTMAAGVTIFLHDGDDNKNFLLKTDADKEGKFRFIFQPRSNGKIRIVSEFRDSASILFSGRANASGFKDSLILVPTYPKGTIKVKTNDLNKLLLSGLDVYVFTNLSDAVASQNGPVTGAIRSFKSSDRGIAFFYGLETGTYYILGKKDSATFTEVKTVIVSAPLTNSEYKYKSTIGTASGTEITTAVPLSIDLIPPAILYTVTVTSTEDHVLSGVDVYLFTSAVQANSVAVEATGFIAMAKTGVNGVAEFKNVPAGTYYVAANGRFAEMNELKLKSAISPTRIVIPATAPKTPLNLPLKMPM